MHVSRVRREQKGKKKKVKGSDIVSERQLPGSGGLGACRVISPHRTCSLLPLPKPWCCLACNICEKKFFPLQSQGQPKKGAAHPRTHHLDDPGAFCERSQLGLCFGEQVPAGESWCLSLLPPHPQSWCGDQWGGGSTGSLPARDFSSSFNTPLYGHAAAFAG